MTELNRQQLDAISAAALAASIPPTVRWLDCDGVGAQLGHSAEDVRVYFSRIEGFPIAARIGNRGHFRWRESEISEWLSRFSSNGRSSDKTRLYRHFDGHGNLLYVGISLSAVARLQQHKNHAAWFGEIKKITIETFNNRQSALEAEKTAIQSEAPIHNIRGRISPGADQDG